jgi:hypothetical protein
MRLILIVALQQKAGAHPIDGCGQFRSNDMAAIMTCLSRKQPA